MISIIVVRHPNSQLKNKDSLKELALLHSDLEVIEAVGENPSLQRNEAARMAKGDWLLFLDNDSEVDIDLLKQYQLAKERYPYSKVFGGPSLIRSVPISINRAIQGVFISDLGIGPLKSRYFSFGPTRISSERELILCNLLVEKKFFFEMEGFHTNLFPNEENEFLKRAAHHTKLIYVPQAIVYREHRSTLTSFAKQMLNYGRGRTKHYKLNPNEMTYMYYVPLMALIFVVASFILKYQVLFSFLVFCYVCLISLGATISCMNLRRKRLIPLTILCFSLCHAFYAIGLLIGFFDRYDLNQTQNHISIKVLSF